MALGIDYAGGRPGGAAIKAAGYDFCIRYLSDGGPSLPGKLLTAVEYADLQAHDVAVAANWETTADRMKAGFTAGVADARQADAQVRAIGLPSDRCVYFSADWDATPADQAEIDDYLRGAASVIGIERVGVYGGYWVVSRCLDNHTATWAWQTGAWSPTNPDGSKRIDPRAHLYQRITGYVDVGGVQCDVNEAMQADFGQHPTPGGDLTPEEHQWLQETHDKVLQQIPNRANNPAEDKAHPYCDDTLGYATNADGYGWRAEQRLIAMEATLATLAATVAEIAKAMA